MGRTRATARRGGSKNLGRSIPSNGYGARIDTLPKVSDSLVEFVFQGRTTCEPPRKRQKRMMDGNTADSTDSSSILGSENKETGLDYIIVRESKWDIKCDGSRLSNVEMPLQRSNIKTFIAWPRLMTEKSRPQYIEVVDGSRTVFFAQFPEEEQSLGDVVLALRVDQESKKWAKGQGRLWTEVGLELQSKDGIDYVQMVFTIKWNTTNSPVHIARFKSKIPSLKSVLDAYFPDPNTTKLDAWTPQDFYQSVHAPNQADDVAATLRTVELESTLYPFQKRAVSWLLRREGVEWSGTDVRAPQLQDNHPEQVIGSFIKAKDARGRHCYISHLFGLVTLDLHTFKTQERSLSGGILAEEMGLGKTLEIISLITLHKRTQQPATVFDAYIGEEVRPTAATLIISPPSLIQQWISEVNRHAPHLKVTHYEGIKAHRKMGPAELLDSLAGSDVVISTYSVLAAEIHYTALNPEKSLRRESKYPRPKSPLMKLSWWRICMDEAQMIESGVSNAAVVARLIPRINAWCVTGTPVRRDVNDLLGLLIFLRYEPYASTKHVWSSLISSHKPEFRRLFSALALRHSKRSVREELKLPAQRRYVITMPFTPIEEQHYQELFSQMCEESGLDNEGAPLTDDWDPNLVAEHMRRWLVRLRQTALHPEVGGRNRRALGHNDGPLRTVDQVLDVMMEQTDVAIRTDQRMILASKLKRGQLYENSPKVKTALEIWDEAAKEASEVVEECREQLRLEIAKSPAEASSGREGSLDSGDDNSAFDNQEDIDPTSRLGAFRNRLRAALEIEHMAIFFRANAYFQIKSDEDLTKPDSPEFGQLEKLETDGYEAAKRLRREILQEIFGKADRLMRAISKRAVTQTYVQIPEFPTKSPKGGIESRRIMEKLDGLATALDAQANTLDDWREQTIQFLLRPLVDEDEGVEITGDEYEESTKTQDEVMVYVQALRAAVADRHDALTGQENKLVQFEVKTALRVARDGEGAFPEKTIELLNTRQQLKPTKEMGSIRGIVAELRNLVTLLRPQAESGSARAQFELSIVDKQLNLTQKQLSEQTKATAALEKEVELFTTVMNTRLEYYRQLQNLSDMVAPYEGPINDTVAAKLLEEEEKLVRKIATAKSKRRYLVHLRMEADNPQDQRICVICRETFEVGALTVCGHQYCKECIRLWWHTHHNCPICKRKLIQADLHEITYKPQELSIQAEELHEVSQERSSPSSTSRKSAIYSEISKSKLAEIKNIELDGPSFTTKIDTLARHLIWLRESDPGAKSIIYSQFKDFLDVLARAFERFRIGFSSIDKPNGIEKFKHDPSVECFLLHARAHSSGLNLVNASHVFLCEPLLNTALELQAIARVDRIGQHQETNVWLYLVDGTVEESIHHLSVKRRIEHIGQKISIGKGKAKEMTPDELLDTNLEEANSLELQQASLTGLLAKGGKGGELVEKEDLWDCLFGGIGRRNMNRDRNIGNHELRLDQEVRRHLGAEAAMQRQVEGSS